MPDMPRFEPEVARSLVVWVQHRIVAAFLARKNISEEIGYELEQTKNWKIGMAHELVSDTLLAF